VIDYWTLDKNSKSIQSTIDATAPFPTFASA
jgi:hypothetical protein